MVERSYIVHTDYGNFGPFGNLIFANAWAVNHVHGFWTIERTPTQQRVGRRAPQVAPAPSVSYVGPGDVLGASLFTAFWGFRAFSSATIGTRAVQLRRSSDSTTMDALTLADGTLNAAAITAFKGAGTVAVAKMYDQTGNGHDLVPTNSTFEQAFTQNVLNGMGTYDNHNGNATAYRTNTTFTILDTWSNCFYSVFKSVAPNPNSFQNIGASGDNEIGLIADRDSPFASVSVKNEGGNPDGALFDNSVAEMTWHAVVGVVNQNAASTSFLQIDTQALGPFASGPLVGNPNNLFATMCMWGEDGGGPNTNVLIGYGAEGAWFATPTPNAPWTQAQATALIANAKAFWGI